MLPHPNLSILSLRTGGGLGRLFDAEAERAGPSGPAFFRSTTITPFEDAQSLCSLFRSKKVASSELVLSLTEEDYLHPQGEGTPESSHPLAGLQSPAIGFATLMISFFLQTHPEIPLKNTSVE